jgi:hypothetical protein
MTYSRDRGGNMSSRLGAVAALAVIALVGTGCSDESSDNAGAAGTSGRQQAVKFAECMRGHGVGAFPDPDASGELTADGVANNSSLDTTGPAWTKAIAACKDLEPSGFTGTKRSAEQQATSLKFAQCIRENGVRDFPDPDPNGPLVDTNRIPSSNSKGGMAAINAAMKECGDVYAAELGLRK